MATSDEFDGDLSLWTEVDPASTGVFSVDTGQLQLQHSSGTDTDMWTDRKNAPRLVQAVTTPLDIAVKLDSVPAEDGGYGLVVTDAARTNIVRLDYYTNGGTTNLFFAHVNASANEIGINAPVAGNPLYLRIVMPDSNSAEAYTSPDGDTWTLQDTLDLTIDGALTVAEAGPYGGAAFSPFPAQTYLFDWVRFDLEPGGGGPATVALSPGVLTLAPVSTVPTPGPVSVALSPGVLDLAPVATAPTPGPVAVPLSPGVLELSAVPLAPFAAGSTGLSPGVLSLQPVPLVPVPGVVTIVLSPGIFELVPVPIGDAGPDVDVTITVGPSRIGTVLVGQSRGDTLTVGATREERRS